MTEENVQKQNRLPEEERKEKTLDRVAEVFSKNGFSGTRTSELAEAAGISEAMLYKLFSDKKGLYRALIEQKIERTEGTVFPESGASDMEDCEVFSTVATRLMERIEDDPAFFRLLLYSGLEENELADMFYEARIRKLNEQLASYIRQRMEEGGFGEVDPEVAAMGFTGMVCQFMQIKKIFEFPFPEEDDAGKIIDTFVNMTVSGLKKETYE